MAARTLTRVTALCRVTPRLLPVCAGTVGFGAFITVSNLRQPMRLDSRAGYSSKRPGQPRERLDPGTIRQMAGGSAAGFMAGMVVSVFSTTLVLFAGLFMVAVQIAARYGVDLIKQLQVKERLKSSRVIALLRSHPTFKLSFSLTFVLAAFAHF